MKKWMIGCGFIASAAGILLAVLREIRVFGYEHRQIPIFFCAAVFVTLA